MVAGMFTAGEACTVPDGPAKTDGTDGADAAKTISAAGVDGMGATPWTAGGAGTAGTGIEDCVGVRAGPNSIQPAAPAATTTVKAATPPTQSDRLRVLAPAAETRGGGCTGPAGTGEEPPSISRNASWIRLITLAPASQ